MRRAAAALSVLILAGPVAAQQKLSALDYAKLAYETCAEIAIGDEFLGDQFQRDHNFRAAAERALGTCQTEETSLFSTASSLLGSLGNPQNMAVVDARAHVDRLKVLLKLKLVNEIMDMAAGRR